MAEDVLAVEKVKAGKEYLAALRSLGLEPEGLFWGRDAAVGSDVLVLVTSLFDYVGPLELSSVLFKAYNLSATPKEIDPFVVRLHSPDHSVIRTMAQIFGMRIAPPIYVHVQNPRPGQAEKSGPISGFSLSDDINVYADAIYKFDLTGKVARIDASRKWRRFHDRVEKLAA